MPTVLLAAIHYGELPGAPARTVIDDLREEELVQSVIEVVDQPDLTIEVDRPALIRWRERQRLLERDWRRYLGIDTLGRRSAARMGDALFRTRLRMSSAFADDMWRARQIEQFVAAKHVRAWRDLLQGSWDELLVVESDATIQRHSLPAVQWFIDHPSQGPRYVNLAGGLDLEELAIAPLVVERQATHDTGHRLHFAKPVTNTSCAYLLNRPLARVLVDFLDAHPAEAALGIDWIFNACFLDCERAGIAVDCEHADPPALGHGSITGVTRSWHPGR